MISQILTEELETLRSDILARQQAARQCATGSTTQSISYRLSGTNKGELYSPVSIDVLQHGRGPGKLPANFHDILARWAAAKGISFKNEAQFNTWAYFVSRKIREEGTVLYRSGRTLDIIDTPVADFRERLSKRLSGHYMQEMEKLLAMF